MTDPSTDRHAAAASMAGYLVHATGADGRFAYRRNLDPRVPVAPRYNEVRHAGTIYAMADAHPSVDVPGLLDAAMRATDYLRSAILAPPPDRPDLLCAWPVPDGSGSPPDHEAKLGGAGLALVALLSLEAVRPGSTSLDEVQAIGRFLCWMQKEDGSFHSKLRPGRDERSDAFVSLYYPGEAALGLAMLAEHDDDERWSRAAGRALTYLARLRAGRASVEPDHWALIATARLLRSRHADSVADLRESILGHARQVARSMLGERVTFEPGSRLHGSFLTDGRTTPTATRLEGLVAALRVLGDDASGIGPGATAAILEGADFLVRSRVEDGPLGGGIPRAIVRLPADHPAATPTFNARATEVRIDYVQHALSAVLGAERLEPGS